MPQPDLRKPEGMSRKLVIGLIVVLFLACGMAWFGVYFDSPPIPLHKLDAIPIGATKSEVTQRVGAPDKTQLGGSVWVYKRPFAWPIVYLFFDDDERFEEYVYDH
jgi:hypothetical protein